MAIAPPIEGRAVNNGDDAPPPKVGLTMHVETPENVVLDYQLAGPAARFGAYVIDFFIRMGIMLVVWIFLTFAGVSWTDAAFAGVMLLVAFVMEWVYYVVSEGFFQGRTIGKRAMGLRVVHERGYPITFWSALLRNLLRGADSLPFLHSVIGLGFYGVGLISMLATKKLQRVGDLIACTVVVTERKVVLPRAPLILEKIQPLPKTEIGSFVPGTRVLAQIEEFLGRRRDLTHERGHALASVLAGRLADRLDFRADDKLVREYPMAFLARVYVTFLNQTDEEENDDALFDFSESRSPEPRDRRRLAATEGRR